MVIPIFRTVPHLQSLCYPSFLEETVEGFSNDSSNVLIFVWVFPTRRFSLGLLIFFKHIDIRTGALKYL